MHIPRESANRSYDLVLTSIASESDTSDNSGIGSVINRLWSLSELDVGLASLEYDKIVQMKIWNKIFDFCIFFIFCEQILFCSDWFFREKVRLLKAD